MNEDTPAPPPPTAACTATAEPAATASSKRFVARKTVRSIRFWAKSGPLFLRSCLDVTAEPANFCDGVPPTSEIMKTVRWRLAQCEAAGNAGDQTCNRLLQAIQDRCEKKR